jgi:hypothetical protein
LYPLVDVTIESQAVALMHLVAALFPLVAGVCYVANSGVLFLAPVIEDRIFPAILLPSFIGELSLCLWLLVKGVDEEKWRSINARAAAPAR